MTIVVTGGSGFIGTVLARKLLALGDTVVVGARVAPAFTHERLYFIQSDITGEQLPFNVLEQTDAVINLVGAPLAKKWTDEYKTVIRNSRIVSTRHVVESMRGAINRPTILINASMVAYYGERGDEALTEKSDQGEGFLADVVGEWEGAAQQAEAFGTRVVCIRSAPIIGHGGLIARLRRSARFGFLFAQAAVGHWQPWIHEEDVVNAYIFALQTSTLQGAVNAVAPEQVTKDSFMRAVAQALKRRVVCRPAFLAAIFGRNLMQTDSQNVTPQRLIDKGFIFQYPTLDAALAETVKKEAVKKNEKN